MALIKCPECRNRISETVNSCPRCGYVLKEGEIASIRERDRKAGNKKRILTIMVMALIVFGGSYLALQNYFAGKVKSRIDQSIQNAKTMGFDISYKGPKFNVLRRSTILEDIDISHKGFQILKAKIKTAAF